VAKGCLINAINPTTHKHAVPALVGLFLGWVRAWDPTWAHCHCKFARMCEMCDGGVPHPTPCLSRAAHVCSAPPARQPLLPPLPPEAHHPRLLCKPQILEGAATVRPLLPACHLRGWRLRAARAAALGQPCGGASGGVGCGGM
jgi:hypothetical protein